MTLRHAKHQKRILQEDIKLMLPIKKNNDLKPEIDDMQKCSICCESKPVKYVNCHKGGLQNELFGKWTNICKDKAMCSDCRERTRNECPFCKNHKLFMWTTFTGCGPKKKAPFAIREEKRLKKIAKKQKKAEKQRRREEKQRRREERQRAMENQLLPLHVRLSLGMYSMNEIMNHY